MSVNRWCSTPWYRLVAVEPGNRHHVQCGCDMDLWNFTMSNRQYNYKWYVLIALTHGSTVFQIGWACTNPLSVSRTCIPPKEMWHVGRTSRHGASNSTACSSMARLWKRTRRSFGSSENKLVLYDIFHSSRHWDAIIFIHGSNLSTPFKTDCLKLWRSYWIQR